jgi:transposase
MARRRVEVVDVVEVLVQWQARRSLKQIARSTGMSRNTVRRYLARVAAVGLRREPVLPRSELQALVEKACPELVCRASTTDYAQQLREVRKEIVEGLEESTMATVWQRLRDAGRVTCSVVTFRRFVRREVQEVDPDKVVVRRPLAKLGDSAEIDFGILGIWEDPASKRRRRLWAFVMTLGASRHMFVRPVRRLDLQAWITCHVAAFEFFGTVPRRLVVDNLRDGVVKASLYDPKLNRTYAEMAEHYGTLVDPCRSGKPKDKPVVERMMPYVRDSFWSGRKFQRFEAIVEAAPTWCLEVAGIRLHRTTRARPLDLFELERAAMLPLPGEEFQIVGWFPANVLRDIHFSCDGASYSAPWRYVGKPGLMARQSEHVVELFDGDQLVKMHPRVGKGKRQTDWSDYPPGKAAFFVRNPEWCREQAGLLGENVGALVDGLLVSAAIHRLRQAQAIIRLAEIYPADRLDSACGLALTADGQYMTVRNLLRNGLESAALQVVQERADTAGAFLHGREAMVAGGAR